MSITIRKAIMEYFKLDLVPESLLKEIESIILEQMIGEDEKSVAGYDIPGERTNRLRAEQRRRLQTALYGKEIDRYE